MEAEVRDTLEEVYAIKQELTSSFSSYDEFAQWLMQEQVHAKEQGRRFVAA